jgi:hypothetical protein
MLRGPVRGRMFRHVEMNDATAVVSQDHEHKEYLIPSRPSYRKHNPPILVQVRWLIPYVLLFLPILFKKRKWAAYV